MTRSQQLLLADGLPAACLLTADQRRAAWELHPPRPMPIFSNTPRNVDDETRAFMEQAEAEKKLRQRNHFVNLKARLAKPKIDMSKHRWDARHNKFVPLMPYELQNGSDNRSMGRNPIKSPPRTTVVGTPTKRNIAPGSGETNLSVLPDGGHHDWSSITKDTAEAIAKLNGVWKADYEKLRGTGRIVMTVKNVLRGVEKRGGTVKWLK